MKELKDLIDNELKDSKLKIDNIDLVKEDTNNILRITIDKDELIDLDDCVYVTNIANKILDDKDPIKEKYILEVCSKRKGGDIDGQ